MMAGADGNSHLVDQGSEIVVVDAFNGEGDRADPVCGAVEVDAGNLGKSACCLMNQGFLVGLDFREADRVNIIERRGEGDGTFDIGSSGFVFEGQIVVGGFFKGDLFDHLATTAPWRKDF